MRSWPLIPSDCERLRCLDPFHYRVEIMVNCILEAPYIVISDVVFKSKEHLR